MNRAADMGAFRKRGGILFERGLYCAALEEWGNWLEAARTSDDALETARALNALGVLAYRRHQFDKAFRRYEEALSLLCDLDDPSTLARVESNRGWAEWYVGMFDKARRSLEAASALFSSLGTPLLAARAEMGVGLVELQTGDFDGAERTIRRALEVFRNAGDLEYEGRALINMGAVLTEKRQFDEARNCFLDSARIHEKCSNDHLLAYTYTEMARLHHLQRDLASAMQYCNKSLLTILADLAQVDRMEVARLSHLFGHIFMSLGDFGKAIVYLDRAHDYYRILGAAYEEARARKDREHAVSQMGDPSRVPDPDHDNSLERFREQEIRLQHLNTFLCFADALEEKDPYTRGHSERVTAYSLIIARQMGLGRRETEILGCAGRLHDVGKMTVSDAILNKPGKLTDEEYAAIQRHPRAGADMTRFVLTSQEALSLVRHHHERFDGKGYPDGLAGKEIPLLTRILSVADAYDALTSDRPYRAAYSHSRAMAILAENCGTQFDPEVVAAFESCHNTDR